MENTIEQEKEFLKFHSNYHGEVVDHLKQIAFQNFIGTELFEFCQAYANSQITHHLDKLTEEINNNAKTKTNNESTSIIVDKQSITNTLNEYKLKHKL